MGLPYIYTIFETGKSVISTQIRAKAGNFERLKFMTTIRQMADNATREKKTAGSKMDCGTSNGRSILGFTGRTRIAI